MIHSTKRDMYWSFWCQGWWNHQDQEILWENTAVEAVEATESAEATEVNEAAEIFKAWKIPNEEFRIIQVLKFNNLWTKLTFFNVLKIKMFDRIMKYPVEFQHLFCWRLLRTAYVTFLKIGGWNSNAQTSEIDRYLLNNKKVVFSWPQSSSKYIKTGRKTLY